MKRKRKKKEKRKILKQAKKIEHTYGRYPHKRIKAIKYILSFIRREKEKPSV